MPCALPKKTPDYSDAGGAVLFGPNAPVVKAHGSSDAKAIFSTIKQIRTMLDSQVVQKSVESFLSRRNKMTTEEIYARINRFCQS